MRTTTVEWIKSESELSIVISECSVVVEVQLGDWKRALGRGAAGVLFRPRFWTIRAFQSVKTCQ